MNIIMMPHGDITYYLCATHHNMQEYANPGLFMVCVLHRFRLPRLGEHNFVFVLLCLVDGLVTSYIHEIIELLSKVIFNYTSNLQISYYLNSFCHDAEVYQKRVSLVTARWHHLWDNFYLFICITYKLYCIFVTCRNIYLMGSVALTNTR